METRTYIAIDLKSFYASVECVERGLDPLATNLVVADASRTEKTICLAVSPSLKSYGISGRARLFEVVAKVKEVNAKRRHHAPGGKFKAESADDCLLQEDASLAVGYIVAKPRMAYYMEYSTRIYDIYLRYVAPEDMHVYSVDEVFIDATAYLGTYKLTPREFAMKLVQAVWEDTGITATAGIGSNLYLCKIAMDIVAKHIQPDKNGVRIAKLDEMTYRRLLWGHKPITDFWRVGKGYAKKLEEQGLYTMGDIAKCSLGEAQDYYNEELLYKLFGVNAELLIDHAWGYEPCMIKDIKEYKPQSNSISSGQVLSVPYDYDKTSLIVREMTDLMALELTDKELVTRQIVLTLGYDTSCLTDPMIRKLYTGPVTTDRYGRKTPKHAHGTHNLDRWTASSRLLCEAVMQLYERIADKNLLVRRVTVTAANVMDEKEVEEEGTYEQLTLFTDYEREEKQREAEKVQLEKERQLQRAVVGLRKKFGNNAVLKGMNLEEGGKTIERNGQIGGHKA